MLFPYVVGLSRMIVDDDDVLLIASGRWRDLRAEGGYHEIDAHRALWTLEDLGRDRASDLRQFVATFGHYDLYRMSDSDVLGIIRNAIRDRRVVAIQKGAAPGAGSDATAELRALLRRLEKSHHGKLAFRGRQYKLVVDVDLAKLPSRELYDVVSQAEAREVLASIAEGSPARAEVIRKASDKLSKDWRAPFSQPDGLVLLRRIPVQAAVVRDDGPALTPSQMKALIEAAERHKGPLWVRIDMAPEHARQVGARFALTSTDGSIAMTKTVKDDMEPGDDTIDLLYDDLWKDLSYSLRIEDADGLTESVFDNVSYGELASLTGADPNGDSSGSELESDDLEAVRPSRWADVSPFESGREDS